MKKIIGLILFFFPLFAFADTGTDFVFDCWQAQNNGTLTVSFQYDDPNVGYTQITQLAPGNSLFFDTIPQGYGLRVSMIGPPFDAWYYPGDCRDGFRDADPQWYIDWKSGQGGTSGTTDPVNIVGYQEVQPPPEFDYQAPTWDLIFHISTGSYIPDPSLIQLWNFFVVSSAFVMEQDGDPRIILTIKKADAESTLSDKCAIYSVTFPPGSIHGNDLVSVNNEDLAGSFTINGCPTIPPVNSGSTSTGFIPPSQSGSYMALTYTDGNGATYIDINALFFLSVYLSGLIALFYSLFILYKKTILGKK